VKPRQLVVTAIVAAVAWALVMALACVLGDPRELIVASELGAGEAGEGSRLRRGEGGFRLAGVCVAIAALAAGAWSLARRHGPSRRSPLPQARVV
jgi:hypothetical protein